MNEASLINESFLTNKSSLINGLVTKDSYKEDFYDKKYDEADETDKLDDSYDLYDPDETSYPLCYFIPSTRDIKNSKRFFHKIKLIDALSKYDCDCEECERIKDEAISKNVEYVLMDEEEKHLLKIL